MSKPKKPRATELVDVPAVLHDAATEVAKAIVGKETHGTLAVAFQSASAILAAPPLEPPPVDRLDLLHATRTETVDLAPIHAAAEKAGLRVSSLALSEYGIRVVCGPHVPAFEGTVTGIVEQIAAYNCKHCGTGGGHHPNCGRPR